MVPKKVELPDGCIITDKRTWDRQQSQLARAEAEVSRLAEEIQGTRAANEALRKRVAEAEAVALEALANEEILQRKADELRLNRTKIHDALRLGLNALSTYLRRGASDPEPSAASLKRAIDAMKAARGTVKPR